MVCALLNALSVERFCLVVCFTLLSRAAQVCLPGNECACVVTAIIGMSWSILKSSLVLLRSSVNVSLT